MDHRCCGGKLLRRAAARDLTEGTREIVIDVTRLKLVGPVSVMEHRPRSSCSDQHCVYGVLVDITHSQLDAIYSAPGVGVFLPQALLVETRDSKLVPARCYISPSREKKPADRDVEHGPATTGEKE